MDGFIEIYRSKQTWKSGMLMEALEINHIPCFLQHGIASGLQLSPITFSHLVPGLQYIVYVPVPLRNRSGRILNDMPYELDDTSTWDNMWMTDSNKGIFKILIVSYLLFFLTPIIDVLGRDIFLAISGIAAVIYLVKYLDKKFPRDE